MKITDYRVNKVMYKVNKSIYNEMSVDIFMPFNNTMN